ncbi:MAG: hypothetical protein HY721_26905, partial [Planctomycetes bacterium]|nr:hypothetical protein [Planctomycetota bacterium]
VYRRVDPRHVPRAVRAAVAGALRLFAEAVEDLGYADVAVEWFLRERFPSTLEALAPRVDREGREPAPEVFAHEKDLDGLALPQHPGAIRVAADLSPRRAACVAFHELAHLYAFCRHPGLRAGADVGAALEAHARLLEEGFARTEFCRGLADHEVAPCPP